MGSVVNFYIELTCFKFVGTDFQFVMIRLDSCGMELKFCIAKLKICKSNSISVRKSEPSIPLDRLYIFQDRVSLSRMSCGSVMWLSGNNTFQEINNRKIEPYFLNYYS